MGDRVKRATDGESRPCRKPECNGVVEGRRLASGQRWCRSCHAAYMREWRNRRTHEEEYSPEQRRKRSLRAMVNVYVRRGKFTKGPCARGAQGGCGGVLEFHHFDYDHGWDNGEWLCRDHHMIEEYGVVPAREVAA